MSLFFKETGNKNNKTIVFIHGGGISSWMWSKQLEYFSDYHCIIVDLPEHGFSNNAGNISIEESAKLIADIIKNYAKDGKAHVIGHSLGAKVVVSLLGSCPEIIDHAVVASAIYRAMPFQRITHNMAVYKLTVSMMRIDWMMDYTIKQFNFSDEIDKENFKGDIKGYTAERLYRIYDEVYQNLTLSEELYKVKVPTLVICGEKEIKAMRQSVLDITSVLPVSKGINIKGALHNYPWVMHDAFNNAVDLWLKDYDIADERIIQI